MSRLGAAVMAAAVVLAGCGDDGESTRPGPPVRVGAIFTTTGEIADTNALRGIRLAVREINARGGIETGDVRRRIELVLTPDENRPPVAVARGNELVNQRRIVALLGPNKSLLAIPVGRIAERARIPMITPGSTNPETTRGKRFVFRTVFIDDFQGDVAARFARVRLGARRAAVLYDVASPYNRGLAEAFRGAFEREGGELVAFVPYTTDEPDPAAHVARIARTRPDVIFLPNLKDDVRRQARAARRLGFRAALVGGDAWDGPAFAGDRAFEDTYYTTAWAPEVPTPRSRAFVAAYRGAYGVMPAADSAVAYDAVGLLADAIARAGRAEPEAIRDALDATETYEGVSGRMEFGRGGDPRKSAVVLRIANGRTRLFASVPP